MDPANPPLPIPRLPRRRKPTAPRRPSRRLLVVGTVLGCLVGAILAGWHWFQATHVTLRFVVGSGDVPDVQLDIFADQFDGTQPSPPPGLGQWTASGGAIRLASDQVPGRAAVRYSAPGFGTGYTFVELGTVPPPIRLRPAVTLQGRVGEPQEVWAFGWRCSGLVPVADAEVTAFGGGERGVPLVSTRSAGDGRFTLAGLAADLEVVTVRVRATGFVLAHEELPTSLGEQVVVLPTVRSASRRGRIVVPPGDPLPELRVLARGLPGIEAVPTAAGDFVLEHLAADSAPVLILHGLPGRWAHAPVRAVPGGVPTFDLVRAAVVRGRVVDRGTGSAMAGVLVFSGDSAAVRTDAGGAFELPGVLPGAVEIVAQWDSQNRRKRQFSRFGRQQLVLQPGQVVEDCQIAID